MTKCDLIRFAGNCWMKNQLLKKRISYIRVFAADIFQEFMGHPAQMVLSLVAPRSSIAFSILPEAPVFANRYFSILPGKQAIPLFRLLIDKPASFLPTSE